MVGPVLFGLSDMVCSPIIHSRWVDQWKSTNNLAVLHAIIRGPALINCTWKCACYTLNLESWMHEKVAKEKTPYIKWNTSNTGISNEWSTQRERTIVHFWRTYDVGGICFSSCSHISLLQTNSNPCMPHSSCSTCFRYCYDFPCYDGQ